MSPAPVRRVGAVGRFATHPDYGRALLVAANRTREDYWNRVDTQPMVFSSHWSPAAGYGLGMYADFEVITLVSSNVARRTARRSCRSEGGLTL